MDEFMAKDLGRAKRVKKEREERAWTQSHLAEVAKVSLRTVQRLERDGAASFETLMAIASGFEIEVRELTPTSYRSKNERKPEQRVYLMPRLSTGKSISALVDGVEEYQIVHDGINDKKRVIIMRSILENFRDNMKRLLLADDSIVKSEIESEFYWAIQKIESLGFYLFGTKRIIQRIVNKNKVDVFMSTLFMTDSSSPKIVRNKNSNMIVPVLLTEVERRVESLWSL